MDRVDELLDLLENAQGDEAEPAWALLLTLQTNQEIEKQILTNQVSELLRIQALDSETQKPENLYKVLYCLQIILSLICEYKRCHESELVLHVEDAVTDIPPKKKKQEEQEE